MFFQKTKQKVIKKLNFDSNNFTIYSHESLLAFVLICLIMSIKTKFKLAFQHIMLNMTAVTDLTVLQENEGNDTATGDQQDISSSDIMFVIRIVISTIGEYNL